MHPRAAAILHRVQLLALAVAAIVAIVMALAGLVELGGSLGAPGGAVLLLVLVAVALAAGVLRRRVPRGTVLQVAASAGDVRTPPRLAARPGAGRHRHRPGPGP